MCTVDESDTKPFSIREYVLATRRKDIFCCWPFSVKNLELCLKHGVKNVLPPLESFNSSLQSLRDVAGLNSYQEDDKYEFPSYDNKEIDREAEFITDESGSYFHDSRPEIHKNAEKNHLSFSNLSDPVNQSLSTITNGYQNVDQCTKIPSCTRTLRHKRRTDKRKLKKRSMADILAVAKHCTLRISLH